MTKGKIAVALMAAALTAFLWNTPAKAAAASDGTELDLSTPGGKVPTYEYQKAQDFVIEVKNNGSSDITGFQISPELHGDDSAKWPFKTDYQKYTAKLDTIKAGDTGKAAFSFTERDDIQSGRYTLSFTYQYTYGSDTKTGEQTFYINAAAKPEEQAEAAPVNTQEDGAQATTKKKTSGSSGDSQDISNGDASYSDSSGSSDASGSVPRVIVTGFRTDPENVKAGSDFVLTIHLKNTSKKSKVKNLLFDLTAPVEGSDEQTTAPAFLPSSGSSSIYLDGINAGKTADISIQLNAKSDLLQKPYSVELSMKYEDKDSTAIEASSSLSIPVKQDARFEFSDFEISPESIGIDDEANVMCSLYNLGRIKLYNVKAIFTGNCIDKEEVFVGNVESGASASIDAMLAGIKESAGPEPVTMTMTYEDEDGEVFAQEQSFMLEVAPQEEESMEDMALAEDGQKSRFPAVPVLIVAAAAAAIMAAAAIRKRRKQKAAKKEEEDLLYELDGPSEDERE